MATSQVARPESTSQGLLQPKQIKHESSVKKSGLSPSSMNNYHVHQCQALISNPHVSAELRTIAEGLVAMASGIDDADNMAQQALERIDIVLERVQALEKRLDRLDKPQKYER